MLLTGLPAETWPAGLPPQRVSDRLHRHLGVVASALKSLCSVTPDHPDARAKVNLSRNLVHHMDMVPWFSLPPWNR